MEGSQQVTISQLPAGFRFHPTDQELINCYLHKKVTSSLPSEWDIIAHIDLYKFNPWDLPSMAFFGEREWFFFSPRDRKYPNGIRPNRAAASGYWKATGTDKPILAGGGTQCIGVKKALVFYVGKPPKGMKTEWVMHEFRLLDSMAARSPSQKQSSMRLDDWVLCRVRQKGCSPAASDMAEEACCPNHSILTFNAQMEEKQKVLMDITSLTKWCDNQLLNYPTESTIEDSNPAYFSRHSYVSNHITGGHAAPAQPRCSEKSTITASESMKRKISPCALDEALFLQAGKRMSCSADGLLSPAESVSVNQEFPEFFI